MKKKTNGRKYRHQKQEILLGTYISIPIGSPKLAAKHGTMPYKEMTLLDGSIQKMPHVDYVPFVHKPVSGRNSRGNYENSVFSHNYEVSKRLSKYENAIATKHIRKTSRIVK